MHFNTSLYLRAALVLLFLFACLIAPAHAGVPSYERSLFYSDFDDRTPGTALLTGGPLFGEPVSLSGLDGVITDDGLGNNFLYVENNTGSTYADVIRWEFLDDAEVTEGVVTIKFLFTPESLDRYSINVREHGGSAKSFLSIIFNPDNETLFISDAAGNVPLTNATFSAQTEHAFVMEFDMDAGTTNMTINGLPVVSNRAHGITDRGVGRLHIGWSSAHLASPFSLDDLSVDVAEPLPLVLDADFEDQTLGQPIGDGGAELGQPYNISASGLTTKIVIDGSGNQLLNVEATGSSSASNVRWGLLDNLEIDSGIVVFEMDLWFDTLDSYRVYIREGNQQSSSNFATMNFTSGGQIYFSDGNTPAVTSTIYVAQQTYRFRVIYDFDAETYSVYLDDNALITDRAIGVTNGKGVGDILFGFPGGITPGARFILDDLQVGASDAPILPSELQFLVTPTDGYVNHAITPAMEVRAVNVFDDVVPDGTDITLDYEIGPVNVTMTGFIESTVGGVATFDQLKTDTPGAYAMVARAAKVKESASSYLIISAAPPPPEEVFEDGFE